MSRAGQNTFLGIGYQADIALLKLLENYQNSEFSMITMEGDSWEDFTLTFGKKIESYEVKRLKALSYYGIRQIIRKEVEKGERRDFQFKIACNSSGKTFRRDFDFLKRNLYYWIQFNPGKPLEQNSVIKSFIKKGWKPEELGLLINTEIEEFGTDEMVVNRLYEFLFYSFPTFLDIQDAESIIGVTFRKLMNAGKRGDSISRNDFLEFLNDFQNHLANKSESFKPELKFKQKTENIEKFLSSEIEFKKLDGSFLTPISINHRLVHYIVEALAKSSFSLNAVGFFLEKVLIKKDLQYSCMKIFLTRLDAGSLDPDYFINFLMKHFRRIENDFVVRDVYRALLELVKKVDTSEFSEKVFSFLQENCLSSFEQKLKARSAQEAQTYANEFLPELIEEAGLRVGDSDVYLDFLFFHYNFTGDGYSNVNETPYRHFDWLRKYLQSDLKKRIPVVLRKLSKQFLVQYKNYNGYELAGAGIGYFGSYSIDDIGIVRLVFSPILFQLLQEAPKTYWDIINNVIFKAKTISPSSPVFLKRAAVPSLVSIISEHGVSAKDQARAKVLLANILSITKGIPATSEIVFNKLRTLFGNSKLHSFLLNAIKIDCKKFGQKDLPTNIFVVETTIGLITNGNRNAEKMISKWVTSQRFRQTRTFHELIGLLPSENLFTFGSLGFGEKLFHEINLPLVIANSKIPYGPDVSFFSGLLVFLLSSDDSRLKEIISPLLIGKFATEASQDYVGSTLYKIEENNAVKAFDVLSGVFAGGLSQQSFIGTAKNFKSGLIRLGEALVTAKEFERAKILCDLLCDDLDPITSLEPSQWNLHLKIKTGASENIITTVRGHACWLVKRFAESNDPHWMKYALEKTRLLLDLNGSQAKAFGFPESNYYIISQASVPLAVLAHPARRKILNESFADLGDSVKQLGIDLLDWLVSVSSSETRPIDIAKHAINVFNLIRDIDSANAGRLLDFFELLAIDEGAHLFIYYALYRVHQVEFGPFEPEPFKQRLMRLCRSKGPIRPKIGWHFWRVLSSKEETNSEVSGGDLQPYWEAFLDEYDGESFGYLSMILEERIEHGDTYVRDYDTLFRAVKLEIGVIQKKVETYPRLSLQKLLPLSLARSSSDFLKLADLILSASDFSARTNAMGFYISDVALLISKMDSSSLGQEDHVIYDNVRKMLDDLGVKNSPASPS